MSIRAVVFDIGGVLVYTPDLGINTKWEKILGLQPGQLDQMLMEVWKSGTIGKITEEQVHQKIGEILAIEPEQVSAFMDDIWLEYLGNPNRELAQFFRALRPQYQTAIISNSFVGAREREQAHYEMDSICDFILYSHEVGLSKPNPRIFKMACERLGMQPDEILFVDDNEANIVAARAMGMQAVLFENNAQAIAEIQHFLKEVSF